MTDSVRNYFGSMALALLVLTTSMASKARAADSYPERERVARCYEACYGPSCYGSNGYLKDFYGCRFAQDDCDDEEEGGCCICKHGCCGRCCCCCTHCQPGGGPRSRFWDICLYRVFFPMSPWYSHPRDGILYPAYGSKSPTCYR